MYSSSPSSSLSRVLLSPRVKGGGLCLFGLFLFLSFVSYSPTDSGLLSLWGEPALVEGESKNWFGILGANVAYIFIALLGVGAYMFALVSFARGLEWCIYQKISSRIGIISVLVVLSASAFFATQTIFFVEWAEWQRIDSPGGKMGYWLGVKGLEMLLNKPAAIFIFLITYGVTLILATGVTLLDFGRANLLFLRKVWHLWLTYREGGTPPQKSHWKESLRSSPSIDASSLQTLPQVAQPPVGKKKKTPSSKRHDTQTPQEELPLREKKEPRIIDSSEAKNKKLAANEQPFVKKRNPIRGDEEYALPGYDLLHFIEETEETSQTDKDALLATQKTIVDTLASFNVEVSPGDITKGPTITRYEIYPGPGLRVNRIAQLEADLARATCAERINILAPVPGSDTVGIEIANDQRVPVGLPELLQDSTFVSAKKKIPLALGKDVYGRAVVGDLAAMPHLLVAGATGSGKSVCINSIIASILFKFSPEELRFIMIDPKVVEMQLYNTLPHLAVPVVTDPNKVVAALRWTVNEMERRYRMFAKVGVRNFDGFNKRELPVKEEPEPIEEEENYDEAHIDSIAQALTDGELGPPSLDGSEEGEEPIDDRIPYIVVIIDELADLMQTAPADVEMLIARIAQKARAAGIHLIVATQTPRADVLTGVIKANIPSRIAFQVSSKIDSRVILDVSGAEKLVGKGDMLYLPPGSARLERSQGAFISDEEVEDLVAFCSGQIEQQFEPSVQEHLENDGGMDGMEEISHADEEILERCMEVIRQEKKASTSLLQRRLRLGYTRAARMMDILEQRGIIGPGEGAKPREILINVGQDAP